jgi:hypothetical protein
MSSDPSPSRAAARRSTSVDVLWVAALVAGASVLWTKRVTETGTTFDFGGGDVFGYFLPAYAYEAERLAAGALPFWNPYQATGVPFIATLQPGALYPARLLLLVTSPAQAIGWSLFAHLLLALLGTYALCRTLGTTPIAAAAAAVVFVTAFALPWVHAITLYEPGAWLPILAVGVVKILSGGGWGWVLFLGAAGAMPLLAGGYQMSVYVCYGLAIVMLAVLLDRRARGEALDLRALGRLAASGALAAATSAPQLLTTLAWSGETMRRAQPLSDPQLMSLMFDAARSARIEAFFFRTSAAPLCYFSIPVLVLAAIGLVRAGRIGLVLGLAAVGTALLSIVRPSSPLFAVYKALPGLAMFRFPTRILVLTALFGAVTAALGITAIGRVRPLAASGAGRVAFETVALVTVVALLAWPFVNTTEVAWRAGSNSVAPDPRFVPQVMTQIGSDRVSVVSDRPDLKWGTFVRQGMRRHVRVLEDYEPLSSRRLGTLLSTIAGMPAAPHPASAPFTGSIVGQRTFARPELLDLVAVRAVQAPVRWLPAGGVPGWTQVGRIGDVATWTNARALPRAYVVRRAGFVPDDAAAFATITARDFDARTEVVLVGEATDDAERAATITANTPLEPARIATDEPEEVVVEVGDGGGVLVLADAFAPGWDVVVDGRRRRLLQANYLVRAVVLEPGDRRVTFRYRAPGFALGVSVAIGAWVAALVLLAARRVRRHPGRTVPALASA